MGNISECTSVKRSELEQYQGFPEIEEDPLLWWKIKSSTLPHFSNLARSMLSIPATSAQAERVFSQMGPMITKL